MSHLSFIHNPSDVPKMFPLLIRIQRLSLDTYYPFKGAVPLWAEAAAGMAGSSSSSHVRAPFLFHFFWLCWVFAAARELPLVAASRGYSPVVVGCLCCRGAWVPGRASSSSVGLVALQHVESPRTRD